MNPCNGISCFHDNNFQVVNIFISNHFYFKLNNHIEDNDEDDKQNDQEEEVNVQHYLILDYQVVRYDSQDTFDFDILQILDEESEKNVKENVYFEDIVQVLGSNYVFDKDFDNYVIHNEQNQENKVFVYNCCRKIYQTLNGFIRDIGFDYGKRNSFFHFWFLVVGFQVDEHFLNENILYIEDICDIFNCFVFYIYLDLRQKGIVRVCNFIQRISKEKKENVKGIVKGKI